MLFCLPIKKHLTSFLTSSPLRKETLSDLRQLLSVFFARFGGLKPLKYGAGAVRTEAMLRAGERSIPCNTRQTHFRFQVNTGIKSHPVQDTTPPVGFSLPFRLERWVQTEKPGHTSQTGHLKKKKTRSISKELSGWNYYWRWDLWKQRVPTGHNLLRCCISAVWALQGILPLRSRLSETRMALYCWVSAWEILNPGRAE